jgi:hypothetical protein
MRNYFILVTYHYNGSVKKLKLPKNANWRDYIDCSVVRWVIR